MSIENRVLPRSRFWQENRLKSILRMVYRSANLLVDFVENPTKYHPRWRGENSELYWFHPSSFREIDRHQLTSLNQPWLVDSGIGTFIDIGANVGVWSRTIHELFPTARIYAFEPLQDCFEVLQQRMKGITGFRAFNIAFGDSAGSIEFYRSSYSASSSFLPMAELHKRAFPKTAGATKLVVRCERLDDVMDGLAIDGNLMVKIDVQGFEDKVIDGGKKTIADASVIIVETSFYSLYNGQPLFGDIFSRLQSLGFRLRGILDQMPSPIDGRLLSGDAIFTREGSDLQ